MRGPRRARAPDQGTAAQDLRTLERAQLHALLTDQRLSMASHMACVRECADVIEEIFVELARRQLNETRAKKKAP